MDPNLGNFGATCDPNDVIFDPGAAQSEACQVDPRAYAISGGDFVFNGNVTRRADTTRSLQIIASNAINTGAVDVSGIDLDLAYFVRLQHRSVRVRCPFELDRQVRGQGFPRRAA